MDWAYCVKSNYRTSFQFSGKVYAHIFSVHAKYQENISKYGIAVLSTKLSCTRTRRTLMTSSTFTFQRHTLSQSIHRRVRYTCGVISSTFETCRWTMHCLMTGWILKSHASTVFCPGNDYSENTTSTPGNKRSPTEQGQGSMVGAQLSVDPEHQSPSTHVGHF